MTSTMLQNILWESLNSRYILEDHKNKDDHESKKTCPECHRKISELDSPYCFCECK